ncbi:DUF1223 domain-containing protein [Flavobacterium sp. P21]|uniref:DUF1223 domain-containing protein n=1 Tax=Flavobacterium sp. P21 TaxID=3423948 RepID=UPI003D66B22B
MFTSEGCSSCPPADELIGKIQQEYKQSPVYILSYHVDYWDRLGWKDIFSSAEYTKRQHQYSDWFGTETIFTPQILINGKAEYIAAQESLVKAGIKKALSKPATVNIALNASQTASKLTVSYKIEGSFKNSRLMMALIQKSAVSNVKRGENANRVLSHFQIVQKLQNTALKADAAGNVSLNLPKNINRGEFEVIGFVQDITTGAILGASKATL